MLRQCVVLYACSNVKVVPSIDLHATCSSRVLFSSKDCILLVVLSSLLWWFQEIKFLGEAVPLLGGPKIAEL